MWHHCAIIETVQVNAGIGQSGDLINAVSSWGHLLLHREGGNFLFYLCDVSRWYFPKQCPGFLNHMVYVVKVPPLVLLDKGFKHFNPSMMEEQISNDDSVWLVVYGISPLLALHHIEESGLVGADKVAGEFLIHTVAQRFPTWG